jgi:glutamate decarboxylase
VFAWRLTGEDASGGARRERKWTLYDLSDRLRMHGWQVPAYPMPDGLSDVTVQRIVVRNGMSHDLATLFVRDLRTCVRYLDGLDAPLPSTADGGQGTGFHH